MDDKGTQVLCDRSRSKVFQAIAGLSRRWSEFQFSNSADGLPWHYIGVDESALGLTTIAGGWFFDPFLREHHSAEADAVLKQIGSQTSNPKFQLLQSSLRFGPQSERLLWLIHRRVLQIGFSSIQLADRECATAIWGQSVSEWPKHWRGNIRRLLDSLTWLHVAARTASESFEFGNCSVLLAHTADLRRAALKDCCEADCPYRNVGTHHHYRVSIGRGFLGALEQCAKSENEFGVREYSFFDKKRLRRLGRDGHLGKVFMPAKLGIPARCRLLTSDQHRLLQALLQEETRHPKKDSRDPATPELVQRGNVPDFDGRMSICPLLRSDTQYVIFGGNGYRPGRGYLVNSTGGWCAKAGYPKDRPDLFVSDLRVLATHLELVVVGATRRPERWFDALQLARLANNQLGHRALADIHLRVYAPDNCRQRWAEFFGWRDTPSVVSALTPEHIATTLIARGIRRQEFARQLGIDPSLLSRYLSGRRPMPSVQLACAAELLQMPVTNEDAEVIPEKALK